MRESVSRRCAIVTAAALASTSRPSPGAAAAADLTGAVAVVSTAAGDLRFRLLPGAPQALALFTSLADAGYSDLTLTLTLTLTLALAPTPTLTRRVASASWRHARAMRGCRRRRWRRGGRGVASRPRSMP